MTEQNKINTKEVNVMKKKMMIVSMILFIGVLAFAITYHFTQKEVPLSFAITFGTAFYHFAMRLVVGHLINAIFHNKMNANRWWFQERKFEPKLYQWLRVKKWKKHMPTYNPKDYSLNEHSPEEIVQVTCQAEIVHEVIMVLSFVPVVFIIWFDSLAAFLITSCIAFLIDSAFVILQRYNRPRLRKIRRR